MAARKAFWALILLESPWVEPDLDSCLAFVYLDWTPLKANILAVSRVCVWVCGFVYLFVSVTVTHLFRW